MLNAEELDKLGVRDWSTLSKRFIESDLLLGNGFSRGIAGDRFRYDSLFKKFLTKCSLKNKRVFEEFGTSNFEFILEKLLHAIFVNRIFCLDNSRIEEATRVLKDGLIETIKDIHPRAGDIDNNRLERIGDQLNVFNDIFTLNYDLFLYRIILILNDKHDRGENVGQYSDFFWDNYDEQFLCSGSSEEFTGFKHPYYLHGALFLFKEASYDLKLKRETDSSPELVELISDAIQRERMPLFVSEGTPQDKFEAIKQSNYLNFALRKLKEAERNLVIFGTSLSDPDQHVIDAINENNRDLAVSIYSHDTKSREKVKSEIDRIKRKFEDHHTVDFFKSDTLFKF